MAITAFSTPAQKSQTFSDIGYGIGSSIPTTVSNKKQAEQAYNSWINEIIAKDPNYWLKQMQRGEWTARQAQQWDPSKTSQSFKDLVASLKDPSTYYGTARAGGTGYDFKAPAFNDPRFSGIDFATLKGQKAQKVGGGLQTGGNVAMNFGPWGMIVGGAMKGAGAITSAVGRRREEQSRIPTERQNKLGQELMQSALTNPSDRIVMALKNQRAADQGQRYVGKGNTQFDNMVAGLRDTSNLDLVKDPATGNLVYAPRNVPRRPEDTTSQGLAGKGTNWFGNKIGGIPVLGPTTKAVGKMHQAPGGSKYPGMGWLFGKKRTNAPKTRVDAYGRTIYTGG